MKKTISLICTMLALLSANAAKPNFVVIMADDMGYNATSAYGGWLKTPHLDRMAREGMLFSDYHSSGVVCSPTRAGLLTGRYQERAGVPSVINADPKVPDHHRGLWPSEHTFPELLAQAGYTSAIFGKWHLGYRKKFNPMHHGFNEFRGFVSGNIDYLSHYDRMEVYDWWDGLMTVKEEGYSTHLITRHALRFIDVNKAKPFCLYVAHEAVHSPFQGPDSPVQRGPKKDRGKKKTPVEEAYVQMMTAMDECVGQVLDKLIELKLEKNTLVIFCSDNGHAYMGGPEGYRFPLRGKKGTVWEGGHRVPGIAWWPGSIAPGQVSDEMVISLDLMPTMLDLAGAKAPKGHALDGVSLRPVLHGDGSLGQRQFFWKGQAHRDGQWKFVAGQKGGLFNLKDDPGESVSLAKRHPARAKRMAAALAAWKRNVETGAMSQPDYDSASLNK